MNIKYNFHLLQPEWPQDTKALMLYLHMLVTFTNIGTWKVLHNKQGTIFSNLYFVAKYEKNNA